MQCDAQRLAHRTRRAVATDQVSRSQAMLAAVEVDNARRHAVGVLRQVVETPAGTHGDERILLAQAFKPRLEDRLRAALVGHLRHRAIVASADALAPVIDRRQRPAREAAARQSGREQHVERVPRWHADFAQSFFKAESAQQLHAAAVGDVHLRPACRIEIALDDGGAHAVMCEFLGKHQADRAGAGDENGCVGHGVGGSLAWMSAKDTNAASGVDASSKHAAHSVNAFSSRCVCPDCGRSNCIASGSILAPYPYPVAADNAMPSSTHRTRRQ